MLLILLASAPWLLHPIARVTWKGAWRAQTMRFTDAVTEDVSMTHFTMGFWKKKPHNLDRNLFSKQLFSRSRLSVLLLLTLLSSHFAPAHVARSILLYACT